LNIIGNSDNFENLNTATNNLIDRPDNYTIEWIGLFLATENGEYTFTTASDDGSYIWLGSDVSNITIDNAFVNNGGLHGTQFKSGSRTVNENAYYPIRILFGEQSGGNVMQIRITLPDESIINGSGYFFDDNTLLKEKIYILGMDKLII
jgi:hypothetical protein